MFAPTVLFSTFSCFAVRSGRRAREGSVRYRAKGLAQGVWGVGSAKVRVQVQGAELRPGFGSHAERDPDHATAQNGATAARGKRGRG